MITLGELIALVLESEGNKAYEYSPSSDRGTTETVTSPQHLTCPEPELDSLSYAHTHTVQNLHKHTAPGLQVHSSLLTKLDSRHTHTHSVRVNGVES